MLASRMMQLCAAFDPSNYEANERILEELTSNVAHIQQDVLQEILTKNANTEYLKRFLDGHPDKGVFKKKVPVVDYEDIKSYIERIANGEPSELISAEPIVELTMSSGTSSGKHKWFPTTAKETRLKAFYFNLVFTVLNKHIKGLNDGKWLNFVSVAPDINTRSGLVVRNAIKSTFKSKKFRKNCFNSYDVLTCPDEIILCEDTKQSIYCQLLCGLLHRDEVVRVSVIFASSFLWVMKFLEEYWQELCSNIREGHISDWITDTDCRNAMSFILTKQMPDLADSIELECKAKSWEGIVKRLWPRSKYVGALITGSMAQYIPALEFYSGGLPLVSTVYACSEGCFGINFNPLCSPYDVSYTLVPYMAYYEFLPLNETPQDKDGQLNGGIVDISSVEVGQKYELLVTTFSGLYRYRVGDILTVTGFYNNSPEFKFVQRRNVVLSIDIDKTTEEDLIKAVTKAEDDVLEPLGFVLANYSSHAETHSVPGHYVLFWEIEEIKGKTGILELDSVKMEQCCNIVEESFDATYKMLRNLSNGIGPLEIRVVKEGAFQELMDFFVSQGTSFSQYKTPKSIKSEEALNLLNSAVVASFSTKVLPGAAAN